MFVCRKRLTIAAAAVALLAPGCTGLGTKATTPARPSIETILVHATTAMPAAAPQSLARLPGVRWSRLATNGMVDLIAASGGKTLPVRKRGAILPFAIAAYEPLPGAGDALSAQLSAGRAVIPPVTARFRGLSPGGMITLGVGTKRVTVVIGAILEDVRVEDEEAVIPLAAARQIGMDDVRDVFIGVAAHGAERIRGLAAEAAAPASVRVGAMDVIRSPAGGRLLSLAQIKEQFGEFTAVRGGKRVLQPDTAWLKRNIVRTTIPLIGYTACNSQIVPLFAGAMREVKSAGLGSLIKEYAGCYAPTVLSADEAQISRHAWGIAVDLNPSTNGFGDPPTQDARLVRIMAKWGFSWGGLWLIPDGMHFEYTGRPAL
ncbi:MAG: M15 family metallopeptidase [Actinomycetota bacterium]|nr:M15 family metallopeptidase [Actinomycetota bacterium]